MGVDYTTDLVYGIKITDDKLSAKLNVYGEEFDLDEDLDLVWSGSDYPDDMGIIVCLKKSQIYIGLYDEPKLISQTKLIAPTKWHDRLMKWAKENDCSKPKIGWWLCISES